jgi:DNA-binding transcriptional LysR family regulator
MPCPVAANFHSDRCCLLTKSGKDGRTLNVRTNGPLIFNTLDLILEAAVEGFGLAYLPMDQVQPYIDSGRLVRVLGGYHLYYPSRRQPTSAFALLVETLRYRP